MSEHIDARLRRVQQQISAIRKLHADDLELILDQLRDLAADIEQVPQGPAPTSPDAPVAPSPTDPAAASPKRAKWLAEQGRRSHPTRRELLRGRDDPAS